MKTEPANSTRRDFLKTSTSVAVGAALASTLAVPRGVHAGASETIRVGVIGAGGRGTGAAQNALDASPDTVVAAIGDTFADKVHASLEELRNNEKTKNRVRAHDHLFTGFDAYKQVIDSDVDMVILATPPHFRPQHLAYAVEKGKHTFVEKPVAVDAPGVRSIIETCEKAKAKNLAVVSGLCWRYEPHVQETVRRVVEDNAIGDIVSIQSCYNAQTLWHRGDKPEWSRMEYQVRNWLYFDWLSGDHICEQAVHSLDKTAWVQGDIQPVSAFGMGGRQQRTGSEYGNIYDHHTVFYEYPNEVRVFFTCRQQANTAPLVDEIVFGTKGQAQILACKIEGENPWKPPKKAPRVDMYVREHEELLRSVREGKPINNGHYMANSSMLSVMGRMCTYTGQAITWEQAFNSQERLGPETYGWTDDVPPANVAIPGKTQVV